MANIGIVGYGIVGKAVEYGFRGEGNTIRAYDKFKELSLLEEVADKSEFLFVCLPTPFNSKGIDLTIMDENMEQITQQTDGTDKVVVIKSSVVPGTTRGYQEIYPDTRFAFNPEFLTEANSLEDFVNADRIIIGADNDHTRLMVADLYRDRFPKTPMFLTDPTSAEMVKYMANCFLATKVIFGNEMYDLCQALDIHYEGVRDMVVSDERIGPTHLDVTSDRGFGGKCFPKDIAAMIGTFRKLGVDASVLEAVWNKNLRTRKVKDWEDIPFAKSEG
ncbi:MAG: hypothetical protein KKG75_01490 [Nanoarchaeota archaeon]|nr:hypothetical protein [Nanoarchaeota archaeon]